MAAVAPPPAPAPSPATALAPAAAPAAVPAPVAAPVADRILLCSLLSKVFPFIMSLVDWFGLCFVCFAVRGVYAGAGRPPGPVSGALVCPCCVYLLGLYRSICFHYS
jgi:hypothetical protein